MKDITGIPVFCFTKAKVITKGLSGDRKFYLETENGECFLARITECTKYERKKAVYEILQEVSKIDIPMPMPIDFGYCENKNEIYTLLTWVDGEDAGKVLPGLPYEKQYCLSVSAGRILRKLHANNVMKCKEDWKIKYLSVIEPRLSAFQKFDGSTHILDYL